MHRKIDQILCWSIILNDKCLAKQKAFDITFKGDSGHSLYTLTAILCSCV